MALILARTMPAGIKSGFSLKCAYDCTCRAGSGGEFCPVPARSFMLPRQVRSVIQSLLLNLEDHGLFLDAECRPGGEGDGQQDFPIAEPPGRQVMPLEMPGVDRFGFGPNAATQGPAQVRLQAF